jgi:PPK2 family polyphosphate:nucleotide phosphotransferase
MKIKISKFLAEQGKDFKLSDCSTIVDPFYDSDREYSEVLEEHLRKLRDLQAVHYAAAQNGLLLIFQAMDAAGKDGAISHVMSGVDPQGCDVHSFKQPSHLELSHDFLWRTNQALPEKGKIAIFNRSYYEEVLAVRVHPELLQAQRLPPKITSKSSFWDDRFDSITSLEKHLHRNGTQVVKFYLHLSKDEQRKRFIDRIDDPCKNWKFSESDFHEREYWSDYMDAYEKAIRATSTHHSPLYVIPADDKKNARLIISQVVVEALERFGSTYPETSPEQREQLLAIRKRLKK